MGFFCATSHERTSTDGTWSAAVTVARSETRLTPFSSTRGFCLELAAPGPVAAAVGPPEVELAVGHRHNGAHPGGKPLQQRPVADATL